VDVDVDVDEVKRGHPLSPETLLLLLLLTELTETCV
jgi:hypothetical protein